MERESARITTMKSLRSVFTLWTLVCAVATVSGVSSPSVRQRKLAEIAQGEGDVAGSSALTDDNMVMVDNVPLVVGPMCMMMCEVSGFTVEFCNNNRLHLPQQQTASAASTIIIH